MLAIVILTGCKKAFTPTVTSSNANILVVEGLINTGTDSTVITLSRTVLVNNKTTANPERGAVVTVENAQTTVLTLPEIAKGIYAWPQVSLDKTKQYRLRIKTSNGKTYLSDLVDVKITPPIDSVGYNITGNGLQIYANTHDASNSSRYYRYTYRETWRFHARYPSNFIYQIGILDILPRTPAQQIYYCYGTDTSAHTVLNSTALLSQDVAYQAPITTILATSEKIEMKYSILVRQQALTKAAYTFYDNLKKNTENLGSIFDAQPSTLIGNIHNIADASEPVIGFICAGTTYAKRIYILKEALPKSFETEPGILGCKIDSAYNGSVPSKPNGAQISYYTLQALTQPPPQGAGNPIEPFGDFPNFINPQAGRGHIELAKTDPSTNGYLFSSVPCTDCTIRGKVSVPYFWK
ncbi:MAG: DUF4249 domain-containing protein [Mucilaginibacter sp.]|nr:DUF4249 domain-containing protein [Mucilaginibacter sp.]